MVLTSKYSDELLLPTINEICELPDENFQVPSCGDNILPICLPLPISSKKIYSLILSGEILIIGFLSRFKEFLVTNIVSLSTFADNSFSSNSGSFINQ